MLTRLWGPDFTENRQILSRVVVAQHSKVSKLATSGLVYPTLANVFGRISDGLLREKLTRPLRWLLRQRFRWLR